ncbi:MAG TPA: c-type cytochrome [Gammaproteobacteria bacterium]|nr:c-type cytochrome [Gammaproteobacteria bacterium]
MLSRATRTFSLIVIAAALLAAATAVSWQMLKSRQIRSQAIALTGGNPQRGPELLIQYGCAGCHTIPGVRGATGQVGPPLEGIAGRVYIAGVLPNTPDNLRRWIENPPAINPKTAMPVTGAAGDNARDIVAYLYTLD